ncbi:MAG: hypothetical protein OEY59_04030, partial [Deltaproteobacteria bacterium]|nr:hypothetical protein [Deltaproteobacteria bacterium]
NRERPFLLCQNSVDVLVNDQIIVQMESPALLGDKGIVEPHSTRAATIRVAEKQNCLVIKIPMGLFIRDFNNKNISDKEFTQEVGIFCYMFEGIQNRLFDFIYLQKNLWEEVNTTLSFLNVQLLAKIIDNKKDAGWDSNVWNEVKRHLAKEFSFNWPESIPLNIITFREIFTKLLVKRFPRQKFKGTDQDYLVRKHLLWRNWLAQVGTSISKVLPDDKLPVSLGELELFNPRNYQMRLNGMLKNVEKNFKIANNSGQSDKYEINDFFGKGEHANQFTLKNYLDSFQRLFQLKHPRRIQAQVAQKSALIAAKCENQFNSSVVRMQAFLDKAHKVSGDMDKSKSKKEIDPVQIAKQIEVIRKGVPSFKRKVEDGVPRPLGEFIYEKGIVPTIFDLVKASGSGQIRQALEKSFNFLVEALNIRQSLPLRAVQEKLFLCEGSPGFLAPHKEFLKHYWIPLSENIRVKYGNDFIGTIKPGQIVGGPGWEIEPVEGEEPKKWSFVFPDRKSTDQIDLSFVMIMLPSVELPWELRKTNNPDFVEKSYLPWMQWLINKLIEHIGILLDQRNNLYENLHKLEKTLNLEKKVKAFETTQTSISQVQYIRISELLKSMLGLELAAENQLASNQISKKIYNHILIQMKQVNPDLTIEERGNKTYTKWRYVLSEIINTVEQINIRKDRDQDVPKPAFEIIQNELNQILEGASLEVAKSAVRLKDHNFTVDFKDITTGLIRAGGQIVPLFQSMAGIFGKYIRMLVVETGEYQKKLDSLSSSRPQSDVQELQTEVILESSTKLVQILKPRMEEV